VLVLALLLISGFATAGYKSSPSLMDSENNLYDKEESAAKATTDKASQDVEDKYFDSADQFATKSKSADAKRFAKSSAADKKKLQDKAKREKSLKAREQDDVDRDAKTVKFNKDSLKNKNKQSHKKLKKLDDTADAKSSDKLSKNSKSKKSKSSNNGKSFANHSEGDDNTQMETFGNGGKHMDGRKHQQAHSFGNQYSDEDMSSADQDSMDARKKNQMSKRKQATDFADSDIDQSTDKDSTDFGKKEDKYVQRKNKSVDQHEADEKDKEMKESRRADNIKKDSSRAKEDAKSKAAKKKVAKKKAAKNSDVTFANAAARKKKITRDAAHKKH